MTWPFLCSLACDTAASDVQRAIGAVASWQSRDWIKAEKALQKRWRQCKTNSVF